MVRAACAGAAPSSDPTAATRAVRTLQAMRPRTVMSAAGEHRRARARPVLVDPRERTERERRRCLARGEQRAAVERAVEGDRAATRRTTRAADLLLRDP